FQVLTDMTREMGQEAIRLAGQGAPADLLWAAGLFQQLAHGGLVRKAKQLAAEERKKLVPPVAKMLRETEADAARLARAAGPETADFLRSLARSARDAAGILEGKKPALKEEWEELE